ncbi:hypothetical protein AMECASPLE_005448 [Ameca splendens]|uniref:Uncharacterized protein n=1 Tax=Ameca splendens TaxID=208324 RepID=A0ABV0XC70_9TELE
MFIHKHLLGLLTMDGLEKTNYLVIGRCVDENALSMSEVPGIKIQEDGKATLAPSPISECSTPQTLHQIGYSSSTRCRSCQLRQETEATVHRGSPKPDNYRLDKCCQSFLISATTFIC